MSYLNHAQDPRSRAAGIAGVAVIHAAIGVGLLAGLTVTGVVPVDDVWDPFTLTPDPLPKPPPPQPQPQQQAQESFVTVPPTPIPSLAKNPVDIVTSDPVDDTRLLVLPGPVIAPTIDPPRPRATVTPRGARPSNSPASWITTDDYPATELRREAEGVAAYRVIVGTNGRVTACEIARSTGSRRLDEATCDFIARRARFEAATDETGARIVGAYTGTVKWEIPD